MEEYLQCMKTLRSQIKDVEDEAANISAEEQIHFTTIQTLQNDLLSAKSKTMQLREDTEKMLKEKGQLCWHIIGKQRKIASLHSDSSTLNQTMELIQQEKISLSSKLIERRIFYIICASGYSTYYSKVAKDLSTKLQQQQDWVKSQKVSRQIEEHGLVKNKLDEQMTESEGNFSIENQLITDDVNNEAGNDLIVKLDLAKAKLDGIRQMKAKLVTDNGKIKKSIEQANCRANHFKVTCLLNFMHTSVCLFSSGHILQPELLEISTMTLEEKYKKLLSDKDRETEYLCSVQDHVEEIKIINRCLNVPQGISHVIKCACGEEYKLNLCA
ncbi:uncharacterized protein LOC111315814 isoform X2 [Durio zibethinus]|uniref:Uncharacterized protein LOC111315814 isoform X2 n=1 Tax=Durio zibethinus TaxID=66656 RepID=A0A6P6B8Q4_DURZI|nr:uncharacterized protein LOC111315814 isoform X2 [Durio zibethinus]